MKKTICILRSNPVNPDSRVEKEARALEVAGYKVIVFCWDRSSSHDIQKEILHNSQIEIYRAGYKASYGEGMKNIVPYLKFQICMKRWLRENSNLFDAVHACDFDTANFSINTVKKLKKIFVFDIFDFICGSPRNILQKIIKKVEFNIINRSDATIICTEDRRRQIIGSNPKKLIVLHNTPPAIEEFPIVDKKNHNNINVVYVGILSNNRLLLEELEVFKRHPEWHFYVGGFGLHEKAFIDASQKYGNIHFLGKISYEETLRLESNADIMLAIYDPTIENHIFAAPNKFYEALMLGKPLIMVKNTGMTTNLRKYNFGVLIDYSEYSFESGLEILVGRKEEWASMSTTMKSLYREFYNWDIMKDRLINMYSELFNDRS